MIIAQAFASTAEHGHHGSMFQDPTFWVGVAFCFTMFALIKLAGKAIVSGLTERSKSISKNMADAESLRKDAEKLLESYKDRANNADKESAEKLNKAKEQADKLKIDLIQEFESKLEIRQANAQARLDKATEDASKEIQEMAISIAMQTVEKILSEKLTGDAGEKVLIEAIDSLPEAFNKTA